MILIQDKIFNLLKLIVPILLLIYISANPVEYLTAIEEIAIYSSLLISIFLVLFNKIEFTFKTPLSLPFALFAIWALIGIFFAINKPNSIHDLYAHLLKYYVLFFLIINFFNTRDKFSNLLLVTMIAFTLYSLGVIIYVYGIMGKEFFIDRLTNPIIPSYRQFIHIFGLIIALFFFYSEKRILYKLFFLGTSLINLLAIFLSQYRSAVIAVLLSVGYLLIANKRYKQLVLIVLTIFILIFFMPIKGRFLEGDNRDKHYTTRLGTYYLFSEIIKDNPIVGIGFGMQTYTDPNFNIDSYNRLVPENVRFSPPVASPHNSFLDIAARLGLVGLAIYIYIISAVMKMFFVVVRKSPDTFISDWGSCIFANFIAFFVQALFLDTSFGVQAMTQYLIFALITILWKINKDEMIQING